MCSVEIDGFREGVKHVRQNHPETLFEDKACPCIVCPKRFARMDHLKNHVYSHVNRIRPGSFIVFYARVNARVNLSRMSPKLVRTLPHIVENWGITMAPLFLRLIS